MNSSGAPTLEVGFAIDTAGSFEHLTQLATTMDSVEGRIVADAAKIERATGGMVNVGGAAASMTAFGSAATRAAQDAARSITSVEKAGEAMVRGLERQNASFGMTREQLRGVKAETAALAAEQKGLIDLAGRIRAEEASIYDKEFAAARKSRLEAEAAAEDKVIAAARASAAAEKEAQAIRSAARAYEMFNAYAKQKMGAYNTDQAAVLQREAAAAKLAGEEHARLAAMVRGSHDAQEADAVAAERLRESTDGVYAATKRVNAQIAESTRLYHAGATAPAEYARQQAVLTARLTEETTALGASTRGHQAHASASGLSRNAQLELTHVFKASAEQIAMGAPPLQILTTHLGQLGQIATMTEGGVRGLTKAIVGMVAPFLAVLAPIGVVAGVGFGAFKKFQDQVKDSGELTRYRDSLGLTHKEMLQLSDGVDKAGDKIKKLDDVTVTAGDVMAGLWKTIKDQATAGNDGKTWEKFKKDALWAFNGVLEGWNIASAGITAGIYGTFNAVKVVWNNFPAVFGELFINGVNAAIGALNLLVKAGVDKLNLFIAAANLIPGIKLGAIAAPEIAPIDNQYAGASAKAEKAMSDGFSKSYAAELKKNAEFWGKVGENAKDHYRKRAKEEADALKENRTPKAPKVDHAALNSEAVEAQIKNLYALAEAYRVSGAAALIAEARVKAESAAIKQRADIEAAVDRQVRLMIAQRVSDSAKAAAAMREQASIQAEVNGMVAAGNIPAAQAAALVQQRIAELPLLAALEAAQQRGLKTEADAATAALNDQRDAQEKAKAAAYGKQAVDDGAAAKRQLDTLREEMRLVGATDEIRVHALATLKATQEAEDRYGSATSAYAQKYIADQVAIADCQQALKRSQDDFNASLTETADKWDEIARNIQAAGQGMADSFGAAGKAIADLSGIYATFQADRAHLDADHKAAIEKAHGDQTKIAEEAQDYARKTSALQIGAFGDAATAAKGFFKEGTAGYEALAAAEKVYRVAQFAMSVTAMVQSVRETLTHVAGAAARSTANAAEGVSAQAKLPFPFNLVAMAATAAALVAAGISVLGGGGSGGHVDPGNTGTGTVLGSPTAGSDSIKNALSDLKGVDTLMLTSSREMAASLKSIDSQIGSFAAQIVKSGDINASSTIATGFQTSGLGSILSHIPLIGGFLGSLFGSRTDITASGLYGGAQTIGQVNQSGYTGQSYSDVEKTSKFFGIVTGRSYSTNFAGLDPAVNSQFTLILKSFSQAITAAAGPLGEATSAVQAKLNGFVVDIGKIDLKGLSGADIQKKLENVFGALGDKMASFAFPAIAQFQKVGEGALQTLVRVASTVESVTAALAELGNRTAALGIDAKMGLAGQFDSISAFTSATDAYFQAYYTSAEQAAAKTAQLSGVFASLGLTMPTTLAGFRQLVEAQDLTTAAGQSTYATLLKLSPAFATLQSSLAGAKSAADIVSERMDLQRQLLEAQGNTAAVQALDLAKLDASNRALQQQVWAVKAAKDLATAWTSVGDTIVTEIQRIRGLSATGTSGSFASLQGQFNAANVAARAGDQIAAKNLPQLSQALLTAAGLVATSRQEMDRIQAQTAASLEATYGVITALAKGTVTASTPTSLTAAAAASQASGSVPANDNVSSVLREVIADLRSEIEQMRNDNNAGHAATASTTGRAARILDQVTQASGGDAVSVAGVAA